MIIAAEGAVDNSNLFIYFQRKGEKNYEKNEQQRFLVGGVNYRYCYYGNLGWCISSCID
jgi:hypothetical protein